MKSKKTKIAIIGVIALVLVTIGITYAYWLITRTQEGENVITTGCLDITLNGENDITLTDQFPMSDEDGAKLTPYTFTVTNNCNTSVDYQVALEATGDESTAIASSALKVAINDKIKLYSDYSEVDATESAAYESRKLLVGTLTAKDSEGASATHELRIWIDAEALIDEMNKTFKSKITVTAGQGIDSSSAEGELADKLLSNYGGVEAAKPLNNNYYMLFRYTTDYPGDKTDSYWFGTEYELNQETGEFTIGGDLVQGTFEECRSGSKNCGEYSLLDENADADSAAAVLYKITSFNGEAPDVSLDAVKADYYISKSTIGTAPKEGEYGLYSVADDYGTSYYLRGDAKNNYVQFGTYAEDTTIITFDQDEKEVEIPAGTPMYWRIVRINGDGTVRLVYDGIEPVEQRTVHNASIGLSVYNTNANDVKYIGYTYDDGTGKQVDSTIKGVVDAWYDSHLETTYGKYIADSIFCNDRSETTKDRLSSGKLAPVLTCVNKADRYTVSDTTNGNGYLSNPVGLLTADEVVLAGGVDDMDNSSQYNYLVSGEIYWTMTPSYSTSSSSAFVNYVHFGSFPDSLLVNSLNQSGVTVRPVINIKADVLFTGKGTIDSPYQVVLSSDIENLG